MTEQPTLDTTRLRNLAWHMVLGSAIHECPKEMVKDLEQAAWVKFLRLKTYQYLWKDLEYAMLEELSRWLWNCKRGRGKNRVLTIKLALKDSWLGHYSLSPEQILIARETVLPVVSRKQLKKNSRPIISVITDPNILN